MLRHSQPLGHWHHAVFAEPGGFKALATTSAGFAWSRGFADGAVTCDVMIDHIAELSTAADVPMNADFEGGYAHEPAGIAESVRLFVKGVAPKPVNFLMGFAQRSDGARSRRARRAAH